MVTIGLTNTPTNILHWTEEVIASHAGDILSINCPVMRWTVVSNDDDKTYVLIRRVGSNPDGGLYWHWALHNAISPMSSDPLAIIEGPETIMRSMVLDTIRTRARFVARPDEPQPTPENYGTW